MKKIFLYSALTIVTFTTSCRQMDDNISPTNVDPATISPRQMMAATQNMVFSTQAGTMNSLSNVWTNTWAGNNYYFGNPTTREYSLDISNTFGTGIWTSSYLTASNLEIMINNGKNLPLHSAIARILKAYTMQYVVDFYGDVPYSEAFKRQDNPSPKYDNDSDVYKNLVLEINKALADIASNPVNGDIVVNSGEDVIFKGDMSKWEKFARNVKLKLLLRQSKVTDPTIKAFVDQELSTLSTSAPNDFFYLNDVIINPGYSNSNGSTVNPLFSNYGMVDFTGHSLNTNGWRLYKAAQYYANSVNTTLYGVGDLRGTKAFRRLSSNNNPQPATSVIGIRQGGPKLNTSEWSFSYLGWNFINNSTADSYRFLAAGDGSAGERIASGGAAMNGYLALSTETKLMLAEAAVTYPTVFTFDPLTLYNSAVNDSFLFYGLTATQASDYLSQLSPKVVGWVGAPNKIAAIQYQRFVSLMNIRQVETYINFLKTGYPAIPVADNAMYPNKPYRLIYPSSEYTGNSTNVPNVSQAQVFVKNQYTPFWNQN